MSEANIFSLGTGCELWYVPDSGLGLPHQVSVGKVGRRWAEIGPRLKVDLETLRVWSNNGQHSWGQCYTRREEYERTTWLGKAWRIIRDNIDWSPPDNITPEQIEQIASILGLKLPPSPHKGAEE